MDKESDKTRWRSKADHFATRVIEGEPESDVREAFEEARPRSREDIMLDVRLRDGSREAFAYAYLTKIKYTPKDVVRIEFGITVVKIAGRRLARLYEALCEHRVRFVQEGNVAEEALREPGDAHIDEIRIDQEGENHESGEDDG